jgi:hypothetical protein
VRHGTVILVQPGSVIRFDAALGPLQELAVQGILTIVTGVQDGKTMLRMTYRVAGNGEAALDQLAPPVDRVKGLQYRRLKALIETGRPGSISGDAIPARERGCPCTVWPPRRRSRACSRSAPKVALPMPPRANPPKRDLKASAPASRESARWRVGCGSPGRRQGAQRHPAAGAMQPSGNVPSMARTRSQATVASGAAVPASRGNRDAVQPPAGARDDGDRVLRKVVRPARSATASPAAHSAQAAGSGTIAGGGSGSVLIRTPKSSVSACIHSAPSRPGLDA